jgi:hypothetical protein
MYLRSILLEHIHHALVQLLIVLYHLPVFLIILFEVHMPMQGIGDGLIADSSVKKELPQRGILEVLIAEGLHKLKHNRVDLLAWLLFQATNSEGADLVKALELVLEGHCPLRVYWVCAKHEGEQWQSLVDIYLHPFLQEGHGFLLFLVHGPVHTLKELDECPLIRCQGVSEVPNQRLLLDSQIREIRELQNTIDVFDLFFVGCQILSTTFIQISRKNIVLLGDGSRTHVQEIRGIYHYHGVVELCDLRKELLLI